VSFRQPILIGRIDFRVRCVLGLERNVEGEELMALRRLTLATLALFVAGMLCSACKEDKPAEQPKAGTEEKKADDKAAPAAKDKKEDAAKTPEQAVAGKEEQKAPEAGQPAAEQANEAAAAAEAEAAATNAHMARTLQRVTAYGVTGPIDKTRERLVGLLPPDVQIMAGLAIGEGLKKAATDAGLKNIDWLDQSRGIGFAFEGKDKPLLSIPITDEDTFRNAVPESVKPDENKGYTFEKSYVLPYGKVLLISDSFRTIDLIEGDLKLQLTRIATDKLLLVDVDGSSLKTLVSSLLDEVERNLGENMPMQAEQKEFLTRSFNLVKEILSDIQQMTFTVDLLDNEFVLRYELATVPDSKLAQTIAALRPGTYKTTTLLPAKSFFVWAQSIPPDVYGPWIPRYVDLMASAWKLGLEERTQFSNTYTELMGFFSGDSSMGLYSDSAFPMSFSAVTSTVDGLKARDSLYAFYNLVFQRMLQELPPENRQMFANRAPKDIVAGLAPVFANLGIGLQLEMEDYRGAKVDFLLVTFDWEKLKLPPDAQWLPQIIQKQIGAAFGFSKEYMVFTFGPNPVVRAKEVLDGTPGLTLADAFGTTFDESKYAMAFVASVPKLLDALGEIPLVATAMASQPWIAKLKESKGIIGLAGKSENGGWFEMRVDIRSIMEIVGPMIAEEIKKATAEPPPPPPATDGPAPAGDTAPAPAPEAAPAPAPEAAPAAGGAAPSADLAK